jgi:hypothetical protein
MTTVTRMADDEAAPDTRADTAARKHDSETTAVPDLTPTQRTELAWAAASDPNEDIEPVQPVSHRKVAVIASAILLAAAAAAGGVLWHEQAGHQQRQKPAGQHAPPPSAGPTLGPLNGTFRVDHYRGQSVIHAPDGALRKPGAATATVETAWWAYTSSCTQDGCTAIGTQLDNDTHQRPAVNKTRYASDELSQTLRLVNGQWISARPNSAQQPCVQPPNHADTWQWTLTLTPLPDGTLKGEEVDRVVTDECSAMGVVVNTPVVATRVGDVPRGLGVNK